MEVSEVRISLREDEGKRLKAYATVTFDHSFVVRNIKVVEGNEGLFVAMPAKKARQFCSRCGKKVEVGSRFCNHCANPQPVSIKNSDVQRQINHQDVAHPINQEFRDYLQSKILSAYYAEKEIIQKNPVIPKEDKVV
jgi:stage V sporulation protein G